MKIALLGYGKMGGVIERLAVANGDEIVLRVDEHNREEVGPGALAGAEVAIEFSRPEAAVANIELALAAGVPVVVGTTGWLDRLPEVTARVGEAGGALFWASNFSVGVNVFFAAAAYTARLLDTFGGYAPAVTETHHEQKLDAPSGTAITLAERVADGFNGYDAWKLRDLRSGVPQQTLAPATAPQENTQPIPIDSVRQPNVPGTHVVQFQSAVDTLELHHIAHSREGFARGALTAARWLPGRRGVFTMSDLLQLD